MKHSISMLFVSLMMAYVLVASAQQLPASSWTNPYFFYHYSAPLAMAPQKISPYAPPSRPAYSAPSYSPSSPPSNPMAGNPNVFSNHDDHSFENTLGSHVIMLSTCLRELKTTKADLAHTSHRLDQTHTDVEHVKNELKGNSQLLANFVAKVENMQKELNASATSTSIGRMPKSCEDLHKIGHRKSGFFTVMGTKTVDNVYCDFTKPTNDPGFQKVIGYFDVKTSPVYFHAQKSKSYTTVNTAVPFEWLRLNLGNAMNTSGIFTAPKSGKYYFTFSGISEDGRNARVEMQIKTDVAEWTRVGQGYAHHAQTVYMVQNTLELAKGNQIRIMLIEGIIQDNERAYTNFVGQLIEEDIVQQS